MKTINESTIGKDTNNDDCIILTLPMKYKNDIRVGYWIKYKNIKFRVDKMIWNINDFIIYCTPMDHVLNPDFKIPAGAKIKF